MSDKTPSSSQEADYAIAPAHSDTTEHVSSTNESAEQAPESLSCCKAPKDTDWGPGWWNHLTMCLHCRNHELELLQDRVKSIEELNGPADGKAPTHTFVEKVEIERIPSGKYRTVKNWRPGSFVPGPALYVTTDGADFGIRRAEDTVAITPGPVNAAIPQEMPDPLAHGSVQAEQGMAGIPFRLVFNSELLLRFLGVITGQELPTSTPVHVRPFKYLIVHEQSIRDADGTMEEVCELRISRGDESSESSDGSTVIVGEPGVTVSNPRSEVSQLEEKLAHLTREELDLAAQLLRLLVDFMDRDMADIFTLRKSIQDRSLDFISFEYLWHLFKPGDTLFANPGAPAKQRRAYKVLQVTGGRPYVKNPANYGYREPENETVEALALPGLPASGMTRSEGFLGNASRMAPLVVDCFFIDFDGVVFGARPHRFVFLEFNGSQKITSLQAYPAEFDPQYDEIAEALQERGKRFETSVMGTHQRYKGVNTPDINLKSNSFNVYFHEKPSTSQTYEIDCDCVIDHKAAPLQTEDAYSSYRNSTPGESFNSLGFGTGVLSAPSGASTRECTEGYEGVQRPGPPGFPGRDFFENDMYSDRTFDTDLRTQFVQKSDLISTTSKPSPAHLELLPTRVFGYALHHREWFSLNINGLTEIRYPSTQSRPTAFDELVIDEKHKRIMRALVTHQTRGFREGPQAGINKRAAAAAEIGGPDLIRGKGRGLTILLHGAPGVGKTSTAESVATQLQRPLLPITCGDLGISAEIVENRLDQFFDLAARWGCVVLLDEADVFLAKRVTGDIERNSLVSVFLRQMEYYSGVLILTTNRVGEFDEAFVSRIHIKLHYPSLDEKSTLDIWRMNMKRLRENTTLDISFDTEEILLFAKAHWKGNEQTPGRQWNGRQIKNAFQVAVALAYWDWESSGKKKTRPTLRKKHFKDVRVTSDHFDTYMDDTYGKPSAYLEESQALGLRYAMELDRLAQNKSSKSSLMHSKPLFHSNNGAESTELAALKREVELLKQGKQAEYGAAKTPSRDSDSDASSNVDDSDSE